MSEIEEFILARVAEDEARASAALVEWDDEWQVMEFNDLSDAAFALSRTLDPARVLAECAAKRAIVGLHSPGKYDGGWDETCGALPPCPTMRHLAAIWSDHPDYRADWRP